jgi:hypothetical protein
MDKCGVARTRDRRQDQRLDSTAFVTDDQISHAINYEQTTKIQSSLFTVLHTNCPEQRSSFHPDRRRAIRIQGPTYLPALPPKH